MTTSLTNENLSHKNERLSGVELYRILAIFLICISHAIQTGMNYISISNSKTITILLNILSYSGQCGNIMFVICSSYFLVDSKKFRSDKTLKILFDSTTISVIVLLGMTLAGYSFTLKTIIEQFFPDYFSNMWFIPIYVLFYLIHPLLNLIINQLGQKAHFTICFICFIVYGLTGLFTGWSLGINNLIAFIIIYFLVSYVKKYCDNFSKNTKNNFILFVTFLILFTILAIFKVIIPLNRLNLKQLYSPILFPMLLFLFNIFKNFKIKSKCINYLASCSLYVYCFHENILLRNYIRPRFYKYVLSFSPNFFFGWVMICGIGMFILGYLVSLLYKLTISKITTYCSKKTSNIIFRVIDYAYLQSISKCKIKSKIDNEKIESTSSINDTKTNPASLNDENLASNMEDAND